MVADNSTLTSLEERYAKALSDYNEANIDQQLKDLDFAKEEQVTLKKLFHSQSVYNALLLRVQK